MARVTALLVLGAAGVAVVQAIDNGVGVTPPMGARRAPFFLLLRYNLPVRRQLTRRATLLLARLACMEGLLCSHQPGHHGEHDGRDGQKVPR